MKNSRHRGFLGLIFVSIIGPIPPRVQGADPPVANTPKGYVCERAETPLVIDGVLDAKEWKNALWTDDFVDIEGSKKPRPRFRTRAKMLWDEKYFYIAAELSEPNIWGTLREHDLVIFQDNDFEVFLDPDGDNHAYYELEINALNTTWDLLLEKPYRDGGLAVNAWEIPGMKTGVHVNGTLNDATDRDTLWTVELALPWTALAARTKRPAPPRDGDQWRLNFSRVEWETTTEGKATKKVPDRREDNWVWSPQGVVDMHQPERWGFVQFSKRAPGLASFRLSEDFSDRERLMRLYHAQKSYQNQHKIWAKMINELGLDKETLGEGTGRIRMSSTDQGYLALIERQAQGDVPARRLTVREDSLLILE